jgi:glycosyltransferase involved in cell wall biosynthesis
MKISLCLPIFRRPEMLAECLDSVLAQTYQDYEIVMKDGCLDDPACGVKSLRPQFRALGSRLRYILTEDAGIFPALNEALRNSTGDILYFLCSDDKLGDIDALSTVGDSFLEMDNSKPCWAYGITGGMDKNGVRSDHLSGASMTWKDFKRQRGGIGQPACFWNRRMYDVVGPFDTKYRRASDFDMWNRLFKTANPRFINKVLGIGRRWEQCASTIDADVVEMEVSAISDKYRLASQAFLL